MSAEPRKRVAIIGGGLGGLASLKECLAEGFEAEIFEVRPEIGGQWAYQAVPEDGSDEVYSTVYDGVILNSCRDTSSFSDFPLDPAQYGDYFSHRKMLQYLHDYADHFGLKKHIHLQAKVVGCSPNEDKTWTVKVEKEGKLLEDKTYDAVFAASGNHSEASIPDFAGLKEFKGQFMHSKWYRTPGPFEGKRVAVIGLGSGAVDIASELSVACKEVHVVTRRGGWILPRYVLGKPVEAWDDRATQTCLPLSVSQYLQTKLLNIVEGEPPAELKPDHSIMAQSPTIRGDFLEKVRTGTVKVHRATIDRFTEGGLHLSTGDDLDVDVVIACTGYKHTLPYLPDDVLHGPETPAHALDLWKLMVPPRYSNLFVIGFIETTGPATTVEEAQARLAVASVAGRVQLPPAEKLYEEIRAFQDWQSKNTVRSERHCSYDLYLQLVDGLLAPLGANPTMGKLVSRVFTSGKPWTSFKAIGSVYFGLNTSAQWRLFGHGKKEDLALETIERVNGANQTLSAGELHHLANP